MEPSSTNTLTVPFEQPPVPAVTAVTSTTTAANDNYNSLAVSPTPAVADPSTARSCFCGYYTEVIRCCVMSSDGHLIENIVFHIVHPNDWTA